MTEVSSRELLIRQRLKDDFEHYAPRCLKIRRKAIDDVEEEELDEGEEPKGMIVPLEMNRAQKYVHQQIEEQKKRLGFVRAVLLKGRQQGMCYSPDHQVLTADYSWKKIRDLRPGDRLMAVDETKGPKNVNSKITERRIRSATVEALARVVRIAYEVQLDNGVTLTVSGEHKHLCKRRGGCETEWRCVADMDVGDQIRSLCRPPDPDFVPTYEDGWFGGLLDGEGSFGAHPAVRIAFSQIEGPVLDRAKQYLRNAGINFYELIDRRREVGCGSKLGDKPVHCLRVDKCSDVIELLAKTRPSRFVTNEIFVGKKLPKSNGNFKAWPKVVSIKKLGRRHLIDLQTSEKTFICEGLVSHNSTLTEGRFFWLITHRKGYRAVIMTHHQSSTDVLFGMVDRYYEHCPDLVKPHKEISNKQELQFDRLDSSYRALTAGSADVGRGDAVQLFHGSEVAFWKNAEDHLAGALQGVPLAKGTEIILESTARGPGGIFHQYWQDAEAGISDYIAIFVPWFWQDEYRRPVAEGFELDDEERAYADAHGCDNEQMAWRRAKIIELKSAHKFKQEYPATPAEAFEASAEDSFIDAELVLAARKRTLEIRHDAPLIIGVDPGKVISAILRRRDRVLFGKQRINDKDPMQLVGILAKILDEEDPDMMFIDVGERGSAVVARLHELGYVDNVTGVDFGSKKVMDEVAYFNKRAEMAGDLREWFEQPGGVQIPDDDEIYADIVSVREKQTSVHTKTQLLSKEDMAKLGFRSPHFFDAAACTFAWPVSARSVARRSRNVRVKTRKAV